MCERREVCQVTGEQVDLFSPSVADALVPVLPGLHG